MGFFIKLLSFRQPVNNMKTTKYLLQLPILFLFFSPWANAQKIDTLNIEDQFDRIYKKSSTYKTYKVIKKSTFQKLKNNSLDSISHLEKRIEIAYEVIQLKSDSIKNIESTISKLNDNLKLMIAKKNSISILGISLLKSTYNIIVWSIIIILSSFLVFLIYRYINSSIITKTAKDKLLEIEYEFSIHKKKSLEREQKLRRQLQDEINKQRGG